MSNTTVIKPELVEELLKSLKNPEDLFGATGLFNRLKGALMEKMLEAELASHLGYEHSERRPEGAENTRNGHSSKNVKTDTGPVDIRVPRDRAGTFEPRLVAKHQRRLEGFDDKVLSLYARGMSVRDIQSHLRELYGTDVAPDLITRVTDAVLEDAKAWQARPLEAFYPIVYLDALFVSIRDGGTVTKKAVYIALGMTLEGTREVLGLWIESTEGAKFWLNVLTELKNRGVEDILFVCCDGLSGFPKAIETAFPKAVVQTCIVHMIRASLRYVGYSDRKKVVAAMRPIYAADTVEAAESALAALEERWNAKYPAVGRTWRSRWNEVIPFLAYPKEIRKIIYTTNVIESVNSQLRKVIRPKGHFPTDDAAFKLLYLAIDRAKAHWKAPVHWKQALAHFAITFADRFPV